MLRPLILYGALASVAIALGVLFLVDVDEGEQTQVAVQLPDNPGDTASGRPTTTREPAGEPTVEQATINGFGTACSSDDLCLEYSLPYRFTSCDEDGDCQEIVWSWEEEKADLPAGLAVAGEREVAMRTSTFRGENVEGGASGITACNVASAPSRFPGFGKRDSGAFVGTFPLGTPPLDLPGVTMYQFEVLSPSFGDVQIFATEPTDVTFEDFGELLSDYELADGESAATSGLPKVSPICGRPTR